MTAKLLVSGVAAVAAIGAATAGMTPVAMASTSSAGTQVPLTREPHAQAPANDDGSGGGEDEASDGDSGWRAYWSHWDYAHRRPGDPPRGESLLDGEVSGGDGEVSGSDGEVSGGDGEVSDADDEVSDRSSGQPRPGPGDTRGGRHDSNEPVLPEVRSNQAGGQPRTEHRPSWLTWVSSGERRDFSGYSDDEPVLSRRPEPNNEDTDTDEEDRPADFP